MKWQIFDPAFAPERLSWGKGVLLKDRPHRKVWLFPDFVIKAFRKKFFQPDPAQKELSLGLKLEGLSPKVLAYGRKGRWRYIVTARIKGPNLREFFQKEYHFLSSREKKIFWIQFSKFLKEILARGIFQPDFHLRNVLLESSSLKFYLLDLHRTCLRVYNRKSLLEQLAYILPPFLEVLSWWEIGRAVSILAEFFPLLKERSFRQEIQKRAYSLMKRHFSKREMRLEKKKPSFLRDISPALVLKEMKIVKNSRVTKTGYFPKDNPKFWIKAYTKRFKFLGGSRLERSFWGAYKLENRGLKTIIPLDYRRERYEDFEGFIIYPYFSQARISWSPRWNNLSSAEKKVLLRKLVRFVWEMHERGVLHGDAKITNFWLQNEEIGIFDLDAVKFFKTLPPKKERLKDLATLAFSLIWFELKAKESLSREIFQFYAFLAGDLEEKDFLRFKGLVEKRLQKRLAKRPFSPKREQ